MKLYQHTVLYHSATRGFEPVASVRTTQFSNTLNMVFGVMNGVDAPEDTFVRYFFNPLSLRSRLMDVGDVIEVNGQAYYVSTSGYERTGYRADHKYSPYMELPGWVFGHNDADVEAASHDAWQIA